MAMLNNQMVYLAWRVYGAPRVAYHVITESANVRWQATTCESCSFPSRPWRNHVSRSLESHEKSYGIDCFIAEKSSPFLAVFFFRNIIQVSEI